MDVTVQTKRAPGLTLRHFGHFWVTCSLGDTCRMIGEVSPLIAPVTVTKDEARREPTRDG